MSRPILGAFHSALPAVVQLVAFFLRHLGLKDLRYLADVFDLVPNSKCMGLSIPKGQWHKAVAIKSGTVILETKDGPYAPLGEDEVMNP